MRIAHLSDIHFFKKSCSLSTFFSKRLLGTLNHYFNPHRHSSCSDPFEVIPFLKQQKVTHVFISGDFTTTSNHLEYQKAQSFCLQLKEQGFQVLCIPGNHDHYTRLADTQKRFYQYLPASDELKKNKCSLEKLTDDLYCLLLDTTLATPLWSSQGLFSEELEKRCHELLKQVPSNAQVIVMNHFPVLPNNRPYRHQMKRREELRTLLQEYSNIILYLHGHTHVSEFSTSSDPLMINCGSLTLTEGGSFHIMDLSKEFLEVFAYQKFLDQWQIKTKTIFPKSSLVKSSN